MFGTLAPHTNAPPVRSISRLRFNAIAGYVRHLGAYVTGKELEWYEHSNGRVLGVLLRDGYDDDFGGIVMGPDEHRCFRCIDVTAFSESREIASNRLKAEIESWARRPTSEFVQGDHMGKGMNLFAPVVSTQKLNPAFLKLAAEEQFSPARALIEAMMHYYKDVDGNFAQQFQSSAFDARFWELYLFALLTEQQFVFDRTYNAPDFFCRGLLQDVFVEAVTVGPTSAGHITTEPMPPEEPTAVREYLSQYMPIKWAGALTAKLAKRYWTLRHVVGKPVVFAIQDFHVPRSMTFTGSTLLPYLYGRTFTALYDPYGNLNVNSVRVGSHRWGEKTVQSAFFSLPTARWISAVLHNPTATLSKFNRMARLAGLGSTAVKMLCFGTAYNANPNSAVPAWFRHDVDDPNYTETWCEGLNIYHNPNALFPLHPGLFPQAMHHRLEEGQIVHSVPRFHPLSSTTLMVVP
jgi:hypothetical protein